MEAVLPVVWVAVLVELVDLLVVLQEDYRGIEGGTGGCTSDIVVSITGVGGIGGTVRGSGNTREDVGGNGRDTGGSERSWW